jgi:hypothetical protein
VPRERDEIWDQLEVHFGPVSNDANRSLRNQAVKLLRQSGATPEWIAIAYGWCQKNFTTFTEVAVAKYYDRALHDYAQVVVSPLALVRKMAGNDPQFDHDYRMGTTPDE